MIKRPFALGETDTFPWLSASGAKQRHSIGDSQVQQFACTQGLIFWAWRVMLLYQRLGEVEGVYNDIPVWLR